MADLKRYRVGRVGVVGLALALIVGACSSEDAADDATVETTTSTTAVQDLSAPCSPDRPATAGTERRTVVSPDGDDREVQVTIPVGYDGATRTPVVLNLHGITSSIEEQNLFTNLPTMGGERGYIVVTPQAVDATFDEGDAQVSGAFWNGAGEAASQAAEGAVDDVAFLSGLLDDLEDELCVDTSREYLAGFSNGAAMSGTMVCEQPGRFAAYAPVAGANLDDRCEAEAPVSVIGFHGDADPIVEYEGGSAVDVGFAAVAVEERLADWAGFAGCAGVPTTTQPFEDVTLHVWEECADGKEVELYVVNAGGHVWPGMLTYLTVDDLTELAQGREQVIGDISPAEIGGNLTNNIVATELMLDFFDAHSSG